ncbi:hypothetical protein M23134_00884 [Microscilla marina ATCC 23134]|uniref:Uncharacterized protein n=2 Tax=Microscilla marina TaxID=1027 RepID=A1ZUP4_MICM2|nr:hypothetical protein M23134_00884 [Microscilla marina ATCC 23134]
MRRLKIKVMIKNLGQLHLPLGEKAKLFSTLIPPFPTVEVLFEADSTFEQVVCCFIYILFALVA